MMAQGLAENGFDAKVPPEITQAHTAEIEASHCGMVNPAQAQRMASAQVARDQFMARQVDANAARGTRCTSRPVSATQRGGQAQHATGRPSARSPSTPNATRSLRLPQKQSLCSHWPHK